MRNRVWLALTGLVMLGAGGTALADGLGMFGRERADTPLFTGVMSQWVSTHIWFWPGVAAGACAVTVLGAGWLVAQARGRTLRRLAIGDPRSRATRMAARVASRAVIADVASYPEVRRARVRLSGKAGRPRIRLRVTCDDRADVAELGRHIRDDALARLRTTLEREDIVGIVVFRVIRAERPPERQSI